MKINEIEYGHWNTPSLPEDTVLSNATVAGQFDGYDIYQSNEYLLILNTDQCYMGYIKIAAASGNELIFKEAFVKEKYRRMGIASILILFVLRELHMKLVLLPNEIVTDDSRQLFYKLLKINKIKVKCNNKLLTVDEFGAICVSIDSNDTQLIIESSKKKQSSTCYEIRNPTSNSSVIEEMVLGNAIRAACWYD